MQKFLKKSEVIPFSLVSQETPDPQDFLSLKTSSAYGYSYTALPDGTKHGMYHAKVEVYMGAFEERCDYSFGRLHGEFFYKQNYNFLPDKEIKGTFWEGKPHGEFFVGPNSTSFYEHGKLLRHTCLSKCPYLCSGNNSISSEKEWKWEGNDVVVFQKPFGEKDWDIVVRYTDVYFDEEKWTYLEYGKVGVFSNPIPDVQTKRVYAHSCIFEKGEGKNINKPVIIPYFLY
ncbi:hypothetical protein ISTM_157 [Insectomime virus]|uniref:MORN repeat-containing protein n=1 Tax=Tunisvirus fontaine2 TaxID=1421067 RepID=V9SEZ0_9VIRU|nr:hypothetical protein D1R32_gp164 [Tunisvirus fontaine2]AHA46055.1 hypothetical protein ISTM_157 [Insectomime virus]AHC54881.1 hypothetical protein TNS_ORF163 [Tunisvirus fontaine2]